jgi:PAS domain S-box-containing protein
VAENLDSIITSWNRGAERLFGYTAKETIGNGITILVPPERRDEESNVIAPSGGASASNLTRPFGSARMAALSKFR